MSINLGRLIFVACIWAYALVYYLEVRRLDDASEWMTIVLIFWLFTFFVILEIIALLRILRAEKGPKNPFNRQLLHAVAKDRKTHLFLLITVYLVLIPWLGFYSASFLAFCSFSYVLGSRKPIWVLMGGVLVPAIIYLIFTFFLNLSIPSGISI